MDYLCWRNEIFGTAPGSDPVCVELAQEVYAVSPEETFDYIDRALVDPEIHTLFSKEQIGVGLQLIYCNTCSNLPFCYTQAGDDARRITGIRNLRYLYANFFDRYCISSIEKVGVYSPDGQVGYLCYMLWDIFLLCPGNASTGMIAAALDVMAAGLGSRNESSIVSVIHGLGHWAADAPRARQILKKWLCGPTTQNRAIVDYARDAVTGNVM